MIYKIDNEYYVKVGKDFVKVTLVYKDNDVDLKPTNERLETNASTVYEEFNFLAIKDKLLNEHKIKNKPAEENKFSKKYSR